jgi:hypothetical protein
MRLAKLLMVGLLLAGSGFAQVVVAPTTAECATSIDGTVVGLPNPLQLPFVAAIFSGTLPAGNYYVKFSWSTGGSTSTLVSPEAQIQLGATGEITVNPPASVPASASSMNVYIGTVPGGETFQGNVTLPGAWTQSVPLSAGAAPPTTNNTLCQIIANDAGWPTGTAYSVGLTTPAGDTYPGYPMQWQLLGPGNVINLSQGLPLYNGVVQYPSPILAAPYGHAPQSISGNLSLGGYSLTDGSETIGPNGTLYLSNPGTFADSGFNSYLVSNTNNLPFLADFTAMQGSHGITSAITGGIAVPLGGTAIVAAGISGFADSSTAGGFPLGAALGVYGQSLCKVNASDCFGANFAVKDTAGLTTGVTLNGIEVDLDPQNAPSAYAGLVGNTVIIGASGSYDYSDFRAYDVATGNGTSTIGVGYGTQNGTADIAFQAGALCTTGSCASQPFVAIGMNSGSNAAASWKADSTGDFVIVPRAGSVTVGPNIPVLTSFTTTAATSDNVTVPGMTSSGHCFLQPTNAAAATGIASVYVSAKTSNQITVTHSSTSGWAFDVMCTPN